MANESMYESTGRVVDHGLVESNLRAVSGEDSYTCGISSKERQDASVQTKRFRAQRVGKKVSLEIVQCE